MPGSKQFRGQGLMLSGAIPGKFVALSVSVNRAAMKLSLQLPVVNRFVVSRRGAVYLRRRSAAAPIVSHAGFDLVQIVPYLLGRGGGN